MRSSPLKTKAIVLAFAIGPTLAVGSAHADFFDAIGRIFGGEQSAAPVQQYQPAPVESDYVRTRRPLDVTVRPRPMRSSSIREHGRFTRDVKERVARERPSREQRTVAANSSEPVNLDPVKNPSWYLDDPTLRRGDIVILKSEVLVYEGNGSSRHGREEFASLDQSSLPVSEKQKLREMAGLQNYGPTATAQASQVATVVTASQN